MKSMKRVLFAVVAMMFVACNQVENLPMENTKWNLTELQGAANDVFADADTFWFSLDGESIVGVGACNRFFGGYKMTQSGSFEVGAMGMTRMACPDMELEDAFVRIIDEADSYEIKGNVMILKKSAEILAQFSGESVTPAPNDTDVE
jgi:heat shock protein HslJ